MRSRSGYDCIHAMRDIAGKCEVSVAQIVLACLLHQNAVTGVRVDARKIEQLAENMGAIKVKLDADEIAALDKASCRPNVPTRRSICQANSGKADPVGL